MRRTRSSRSPLILALALPATVFASSCSESSSGRQPIMLVSAVPGETLVGGDNVTIRACGTSGEAFLPVGAVIEFNTTIGTFPNGLTTTTEMVSDPTTGCATTVLTPPSDPDSAGTASVTAVSVDTMAQGRTSVIIDVVMQPCSITANFVTGNDVELERINIPADGTSTTLVRARPVGSDGEPASGVQVTFSTTDGSFVNSVEGDEKIAVSVSNALGVASATLRSTRVSVDEVTVNASFECDELTVNTRNEIIASFSDNQTGARVAVESLEPSILGDGQSDVEIQVLVEDAEQTSLAQVSVTLSTDLGFFRADDGSDVTSIDVTTDEMGRASAFFYGGPPEAVVLGTANITATATVDNTPLDDATTVVLRGLGFVEFVSAEPQVLGVKSSGVNETSRLTFKVLDTARRPLPNVRARATITNLISGNSIGGATISPTQGLLSDSLGEVTTVLTSGTVAAGVAVTLTATVGAVELQATSPAIAITGINPSYREFTFRCQFVNAGGLLRAYPDIDTVFDEYSCQVSLADRFTNIVGNGTEVQFRAEAGSIDATASVNETGQATAAYRMTLPAPKDVDPCGGGITPTCADEPSFQETLSPGWTVTHNPRDGMLTLIAATVGEEEFVDVNANGLYDAGEPFVDLPEPFVDFDDDNTWSQDESFIDVNQNGTWDGGNGIWDEFTVIWRPAYMAWTGHPVGGGSCDPTTGQPRIDGYSSFCLSQGGSPVTEVCQGEVISVNLRLVDINMNPLNPSAIVTYEAVETPGKFAIDTFNYADIPPAIMMTRRIEEPGGVIMTDRLEIVRFNNNIIGNSFIVPKIFEASTGEGGAGAPVEEDIVPQGEVINAEVNYSLAPGGGTGDGFTVTFSQGLTIQTPDWCADEP